MDLPFLPLHPGRLTPRAASIHLLLTRFSNLAALELRQAGIGMAMMLGFGIAAGMLLVTAWLGIIAWLVLFFVRSGAIGWPTAVGVAVLLCLAGAALMSAFAIKRSKDLLVPATRRQLHLQREPHATAQSNTIAQVSHE